MTPEEQRARSRIGARLKAARKRLRYTQKQVAEGIHSRLTGNQIPDLDVLTDYVKRWERGGAGIGPRYRRPYAQVLGTTVDELFTDDGEAIEADNELFDLTARAGASDLPDGALDLLDGVVDRLCRDYPTVAPEQLTERGRAYLAHVLRFLDGRVSLAEHRELLVRAGWLSVLLSCTLFDAGDRFGAELVRRTARRLGEQAGHGEVLAWSWEVAAWFALVERNFDDVVAYSEAGLRHASATNAAVQLTLQAGRGYARMRDRRAIDALKTGRAILDQLPRPDHPEHHFVFDHDKYEFYCSTIYTMLGQDDAAEEHATEVIAQCRRPDDSVRWPMRYAMVNLDLGLVAGRRRDLEGAVRHGTAALEPARRSGDLLPRAAELHGRLEEDFPRERRVAEFAEQLHEEHRALPERAR